MTGWNAELEIFHHAALEDADPIAPRDMVAAVGKLGGERRWSEAGAPGETVRAARYMSETQRMVAERVTRWANDDGLRSRLRDGFGATLERTRPGLIVAHALGGVIVYDWFIRSSRKRTPGLTLLTLGSPLGNDFVRAQFAGRLQALDIGYWFNLHNPNDATFAPSLRLVDEKFEEVRTLFDTPASQIEEPAAYLTHENVTLTVWSDISKTGAARTDMRRVRKVARSGGVHPDRALIVGIDAYPEPDMQLEGCSNDAFLMSEVLQENGFEPTQVRMLLNERATAEAIWERLDWLLDGAGSQDRRVFYFAGHGTQLSDYGADETVDRLDEALVPVDFDWTRERSITDDRFHRLYSQLPYDTKFIAILDCCHSGGLTRAGGRPRGLSPPDDIRHRTMRWNSTTRTWEQTKPGTINEALQGNEKTRWIGYYGENNQRRLGRATDLLTGLGNRSFNRLRGDLNHHGPYLPVLLQACQEDELASEYRHGNVSYGAFTYALADILRRVASSDLPDLARLEQLVQTRVRQIVGLQRPQIVAPGPRYSEPLFQRK